MQKVLVITYYWPPGGGAGVQRWLKMTKYLAQQGVEVHVLSVDPYEASYMQRDESLLEDVHPSVKVHLTSSFEPINYYARIVGKSKVPTAGYSNVDEQSLLQKIVSGVRSNVFIPDPRVGWNKYAFRKAVEVISKFDIKNIITTSPPHSTQLIGLKLKKKLGNSIKWISDFRDPWTDIYYYKLLRHSFISNSINKNYERQALEQSDHIITVGERFMDSFLSKSTNVDKQKFSIIPNGFDPEDFEGLRDEVVRNEEFTITYTGTLSDHYEPEVFFRALARTIAAHPELKFRFVLVGIVSKGMRSMIEDYIGDSAEFKDPVPHHDAIRFMLRSHVLLLITQGSDGTIPGKTFEYLASRNRIICIGTGDVSIAIENCKAGKSFEREEEDAVFAYLEESISDYAHGRVFIPDESGFEQYSRPYLADQVRTLLG